MYNRRADDILYLLRGKNQDRIDHVGCKKFISIHSKIYEWGQYNSNLLVNNVT